MDQELREKGVETSLMEDEVPSSRDKERRRGTRPIDVDEEQHYGSRPQD